MRYLTFIVALALSACDNTIDVQPAAPVVFIGDSITVRWYIPADASPTLGVLVPHSIDAGISGQTSELMLKRFPTDVLSANPGIVVIEAGTNDLSRWGVSHFSGHEPLPFPTVDAISSMAQKAAASGARVLIASVIQTSMPQFGVSAGDIAAFNEALRTLCDSYGYTYLDYQAALETPDGAQDQVDFISDHVHPSVAGFKAMWQVLGPRL